MNSSIAVLLGLSSLMLVSSGWAQNSTTPVPLSTQVQEVAEHLEGTMDTSAQARTNPTAPQVQMTTCRIQVTNNPAPTSAIFLYQEQALVQRLDQPYRQRFLEISSSIYSQSVRSRSFKPSQPEQWQGFCSKPLAERQLTWQQLGTEVCRVFLRRSGNTYIGNTPVDGCPANVRGAVRITNHIRLDSQGMETWDRGLDAEGNQVWGAESAPYRFQRTSP